ncbi:hypothetical protein [Aureispira anguillae]|uniref:Lipoprotein n=1 Tax=Aureispira anguillae TaxID=2864201 RepID=A0A916DX57_9BACT|nr:hypothetical protein [Aureispira anguillae]BDS15415.1 hypothetical protein AsAng_0061990 [Aureispira anguillae]
MDKIRIVFFFLLVVFSSCFTRNNILFNEDSFNVNIEEEFIFIRADSINKLLELKKKPAFLMNPYFDYDCHGLWPSMRHQTSFRVKIINAVTNKKALEYIVNLESLELDILPLPDTTEIISIHRVRIPFCNFSYRTLAKYRLEELKNLTKEDLLPQQD